ncbi:hypothetical protein FWP31_05165 [Vibrio cholerae]|nr:hypothetical protein [Vibrio cholerae]
MDRYKYATTWTEHEGYLGVSAYRAFCACRLLDFDENVSHFSRNDKTLTYVLNGKKRQLTPDFNVRYKKKDFYLHCYKNSSFTKEQIKCLHQQHSIYLWTDSFLLDNPMVKNIDLMRRYHKGSLSPDFGRTLLIPTLLDRPITAKGLCEQLNYSLGEANMQLLQLAAYGKLSFDIRQPYSENTVFHIVLEGTR